MTSIENLYYAIGELAYAVAFSDGKVQMEEREKFHTIVSSGLNNKHVNFDISDIVFQILDKDKVSSSTAYEWAMKEIKINSHYLSPELKRTFITTMEKVAEAFPPITIEELNMLLRFKKEIMLVEGDPVYFEKTA